MNPETVTSPEDSQDNAFTADRRLAKAFAIGFFMLLLRSMMSAIPSSAQRIPEQYIVVLNDNVSDETESSRRLVKTHGLGFLQIYHHAFKGFAAVIPDQALQKVKDDPEVAFVSEDRSVSILQSSQIIPTGIDRVNAENKTNLGTGVHVAVIDTGIDLKHPDLMANIAGGKNCSTGKSYADGNGHGTHVAGTIAALNNAAGVVGISPEAKLWSVRVLNNSGSGTWSSVICGIDFVISKSPGNGGPITVANMSLGGGGTSDNNCGNLNSDALHKAICKARDNGVTVVVAAGNSAADASFMVPAAYDDAVITVSALADSDGKPGGLGASTTYGADDTFASFSNFGNVVDLGAPGVDIASTWKGGGYATISGTSMATPHVSGAAALYIHTHPGASWIEVRDSLKTLGELNGNGHNDPSHQHPEPVLMVGQL